MNKQERYYLWVWLFYWASVRQANTYRAIYYDERVNPYFWGGLLPKRKKELRNMAIRLRDEPPKMAYE